MGVLDRFLNAMKLNDNDGYEGDIDIFMLDEWDASEDMTNEDKERFDAIRKKYPITLINNLNDLNDLI